MDPVIIATALRGKKVLLSEFVGRAEKERVYSLLQRDYPFVINLEMRIDPWPVVFDQHGTIRWKEDTMISGLTVIAHGSTNRFAQGAEAREQHDRRPLDLDLLLISLGNDCYTRIDYLRYQKRSGYSLAGYGEITSSLDWYDQWEEEISPDMRQH